MIKTFYFNLGQPLNNKQTESFKKANDGMFSNMEEIEVPPLEKCIFQQENDIIINNDIQEYIRSVVKRIFELLDENFGMVNIVINLPNSGISGVIVETLSEVVTFYVVVVDENRVIMM